MRIFEVFLIFKLFAEIESYNDSDYESLERTGAPLYGSDAPTVCFGNETFDDIELYCIRFWANNKYGGK